MDKGTDAVDVSQLLFKIIGYSINGNHLSIDIRKINPFAVILRSWKKLTGYNFLEYIQFIIKTI